MIKYTRGYCEHCCKTTGNIYQTTNNQEMIYCSECNKLKIKETDDYIYRIKNDNKIKQETQDYLNKMAQYREANANEIAMKTNKINNKKVISKTYTPKCPTCGSPDIVRISTTSKVTNTILFGLLGNKRKKTFHCNNCKYEW